jgi:hypothetical protein
MLPPRWTPWLLSVIGSFRICSPYPSVCAQRFRDVAGAGNDFDALTDQLPEQLLSCRIHEGEGGEYKAGPESVYPFRRIPGAGPVRRPCRSIPPRLYIYSQALESAAEECAGLRGLVWPRSYSRRQTGARNSIRTWRFRSAADRILSRTSADRLGLDSDNG